MDKSVECVRASQFETIGSLFPSQDCPVDSVPASKQDRFPSLIRTRVIFRVKLGEGGRLDLHIKVIYGRVFKSLLQ